MLRPLRASAHPLFWGAAALLALNDRVFKSWEALPSLIRGKLSDFSGLFVAVPLLCLLFFVRTRRGVWAVAAFLCLAFSAIKVSPEASALYEAVFSFVPARNVVDPTDLVALPMVFISACWVIRVGQDPKAPLGRARLGALLAAPFCIATSRPPCDDAAAQALEGCVEAMRSPRSNFVGNASAAPLEVRIRDHGLSCTTPLDKLPLPVSERTEVIAAGENVPVAPEPLQEGACRLYTFSIGVHYPTVVLLARGGTYNVPRSADAVMDEGWGYGMFPSGVVFHPERSDFVEILGTGDVLEEKER